MVEKSGAGHKLGLMCGQIVQDDVLVPGAKRDDFLLVSHTDNSELAWIGLQ